MARVAVVGAGWAGLAAAVQATRAGHRVTVFEAARTLGGRARTLLLTLPDGTTACVDNGQHILIGAYAETLGLMQQVGVAPQEVLHALPLRLLGADGCGLRLPPWPAPLDAGWGIARAQGWDWRDKLSLLRAALRWRRAGFRCPPSMSVQQLSQGLRPRVVRELIEPLCVSALNTPPEDASAAVFLRVLQDSLFAPGWGRWGGSWLLLPRAPLGALFPDAAGRWLQAEGAELRTGCRVTALVRVGAQWRVDTQTQSRAEDAVQPLRERAARTSGESSDERSVLPSAEHPLESLVHGAGTFRRGPPVAERTQVHERGQTHHATQPPPTLQDADFDAVVLACPSTDAERLVRESGVTATQWLAQAQGLRHEPIATVYTAGGPRLAHPLLTLRSGPDAPAQFVFDRSQLGGPDGLLAFVVSASRGSGAELQRQVLEQARTLGWHGLKALRTVVEKRATFACTPGLQRPHAAIAPGLWACGDWTEGPYPATLEGAVRSGLAVARSL
ncbi:FAD-dependent oxidoreductase [Ramlibacter sp. AN1015]|uniref:hydroxysqualene dehydroxylase n=1 Tax=Ramlibacter sp. AN1015 TaxID=3133428 RepID=UPI0030C1697E